MFTADTRGPWYYREAGGSDAHSGRAFVTQQRGPACALCREWKCFGPRAPQAVIRPESPLLRTSMHFCIANPEPHFS